MGIVDDAGVVGAVVGAEESRYFPWRKRRGGGLLLLMMDWGDGKGSVSGFRRD